MSSENIVTEIIGQVQEASTEQPQETQAPETTEATVEQPQQDDMSARFAALSRKEKYLQEQQAAFKEQQAKYQSAEELASKFKEDPKAMLEHYGMSFDDLIAASLGEDAPAPTPESQIEKLRQEIEGFKTEQQKREEAAKKAEEEAYQNSIDEAVAAHQLKIADHISENADKYALIKLQGSEDLVWEVTEAHYEQSGEVLSPEQAADQVEAYIEKFIKSAMELPRFSNLAKGTEENTSPLMVEKQESTPTNVTKSQTLTQDLAQQAAPANNSVSVDIEDSKRKAAALLKWK